SGGGGGPVGTPISLGSVMRGHPHVWDRGHPRRAERRVGPRAGALTCASAQQLAAPDVVRVETRVGEEPAQERQAEPDDARRVPVDAVDEPAAERLDREGPRALQRLPGAEVDVEV